ncbi:MAG: hypothetical protein ACYTAQ_10730 [Planctomycetota bacterium]
MDRFEDDATGVISLELALGRPLDELERRWRQWLRQQPRRGAQEG